MQRILQGAAVWCLGAMACAFAANPAAKPPAPMTKPAYEAAKSRIAQQLKADRKICDARKGQAQDLCEAQAEGRSKSEQAKLEARYRPSPDTILEAKIATAEANYRVEKEKCDALKGKAEDRCQKQAKAGREAAVRQARVEKVDATGGIFGEGTAGKAAAKAPKS
jgi:hypothetical protein